MAADLNTNVDPVASLTATLQASSLISPANGAYSDILTTTSAAVTAPTLDSTDTTSADKYAAPTRAAPTAVIYAGERLVLPSADGVFRALPAEVFEIVLTKLFTDAFESNCTNWPARNALRNLAKTNEYMKNIVQRELTHFFGRWSAEKLARGRDWMKIAASYHWLRDRSLTWDL